MLTSDALAPQAFKIRRLFNKFLTNSPEHCRMYYVNSLHHNLWINLHVCFKGTQISAEVKNLQTVFSKYYKLW